MGSLPIRRPVWYRFTLAFGTSDSISDWVHVGPDGGVFSGGTWIWTEVSAAYAPFVRRARG